MDGDHVSTYVVHESIANFLRLILLANRKRENMTYPSLIIAQPQSINSNVDLYPLLMFPSCSDGHLQVSQGFLAHPVSPGLGYL